VITRFAGWSIEFMGEFFRTLLGMIALGIIQALVNKALEPITTHILDLVGGAGTLPRLAAILAIFALQFWVSYKILVFLINRTFNNDQPSGA